MTVRLEPTPQDERSRVLTVTADRRRLGGALAPHPVRPGRLGGRLSDVMLILGIETATRR